MSALFWILLIHDNTRYRIWSCSPDFTFNKIDSLFEVWSNSRFLLNFCCRDPSSALTLATRLYEETRLGNYNIYSSTLDFTISSYVWDFKTSLFAAGFAFKPAQHFYSGFHCFSVTSSFCLYRVIACFCGSKLPLFSILTVEWFYKHIFLSLSQHFFLPNSKSLVKVY